MKAKMNAEQLYCFNRLVTAAREGGIHGRTNFFLEVFLLLLSEIAGRGRDRQDIRLQGDLLPASFRGHQG